MATQLALRRWPNVGPTSILTLGQRRLTNVGPTWICQLAQRWRAKVGPTLCQHRPNVGPKLAQRYANDCMPTLNQHWPNVCLNKRLNKQSSWVTGDLRHQCDRRQCDIHMSKDVTVLFRRCTDWSKHNVQKDNGLSLAGANPLSEPTLVYIVNWTLANKLLWKCNRNSYIPGLHSRKWIWKCRLEKWRPFCLGLNELIWIKFSC